MLPATKEAGVCLNKVERPRERGKSKREGGEIEDDKDVVVPVGGEGICWPARAHLLRGGMSVDESEARARLVGVSVSLKYV